MVLFVSQGQERWGQTSILGPFQRDLASWGGLGCAMMPGFSSVLLATPGGLGVPSPGPSAHREDSGDWPMPSVPAALCIGVACR